MKGSIFVGAAALLLLGGCGTNSQYPLASTYPISHQQKMQAAHHWDVLAENEAKRIAATVSGSTRPVHVLPPATKTPFTTGFHSLLVSQLVKQGVNVVTTAGDARHVEYDVQVIRHSDRGYLRPEPGTYTMLTASVAVIHEAAHNMSHAGVLALPAAVAADEGSGHIVTGPLNTEVIITVKVADNNQLLMSDSSIYYINAADSAHYAKSGKPLKVTDQ